MTIDPTELARLKALAQGATQGTHGVAEYVCSGVANPQVVLALIAEVERLQSQLAQVSEVACERRLQLQTQTNLRVAAEERAGRKNVARLEAEIERMNDEAGRQCSAGVVVLNKNHELIVELERLQAAIRATPIQVIAMGRKGEP